MTLFLPCPSAHSTVAALMKDIQLRAPHGQPETAQQQEYADICLWVWCFFLFLNQHALQDLCFPSILTLSSAFGRCREGRDALGRLLFHCPGYVSWATLASIPGQVLKKVTANYCLPLHHHKLCWFWLWDSVVEGRVVPSVFRDDPYQQHSECQNSFSIKIKKISWKWLLQLTIHKQNHWKEFPKPPSYSTSTLIWQSR